MSYNRDELTDKMANNLPVLRKMLKLTQEDLGRIIGSSRSNIMEIETKKRKMTWTTFLSLVFLFEKNEGTAVMLRALNIYTDELDAFIKQEGNAEF